MVALERDLEPIPPSPRVSADAIPPAARRVGVSPRQVFVAILIGSLFLACFASRDLPSWSERLGDGRFGTAAQRLAAEWDDTMARLGLTHPHEVLRQGVQRMLDLRWTGGD